MLRHPCPQIHLFKALKSIELSGHYKLNFHLINFNFFTQPTLNSKDPWPSTGLNILSLSVDKKKKSCQRYKIAFIFSWLRLILTLISRYCFRSGHTVFSLYVAIFLNKKKTFPCIKNSNTILKIIRKIQTATINTWYLEPPWGLVRRN